MKNYRIQFISVTILSFLMFVTVVDAVSINSSVTQDELGNDRKYEEYNVHEKHNEAYDYDKNDETVDEQLLNLNFTELKPFIKSNTGGFVKPGAAAHRVIQQYSDLKDTHIKNKIEEVHEKYNDQLNRVEQIQSYISDTIKSSDSVSDIKPPRTNIDAPFLADDFARVRIEEKLMGKHGKQNTAVQSAVKAKPKQINIKFGIKEEKKKLTDVADAFRRLDLRKKNIKKSLKKTINKDIENVLKTVPVRFGEEINPDDLIKKENAEEFIKKKRQEKLKLIREKITKKQEKLDGLVDNALDTEMLPDPVRQVSMETVLKSSLKEIELIIESETGTDVDLSPRARVITDSIKEDRNSLKDAQKELKDRGGLGLYMDSDNDGISDYDEKYIYHTDPYNSFTSGSSLTDGERVLLGFDVHTKGAERVAVESPKLAGVENRALFELRSIKLKKVLYQKSLAPHYANVGKSSDTATPLAIANTAGDTAPGEITEQVDTKDAEITSAVADKNIDDTQIDKSSAEEIEVLEFEGQALPNSFVTLYIFSTPIVVTVKTDKDGNWKYQLDVELEDGEHELYVASVNNAGRILAKSPAIPFVKTAEAAEFTPLVASVEEKDFVSVLKDNVLVFAVFVFALFMLVVVSVFGLMQTRHSV